MCPLTQVTFNLEVKAWFTLTSPADGNMVATTPVPSNSKVTYITVSVRLNLQFSCSLVDSS